MNLILHIKEQNNLMCGASGRRIKSLVRDVFHTSEVAVDFQSVWPGDAEEEHRHSGRGLPGNTHHRVKGALLRFSCSYQRDARHGESNNVYCLWAKLWTPRYHS